MLSRLSWSERAALLAVEFAKSAARFDQFGSFSAENFRLLEGAGFLSMTAPKNYGGGGANLSTAVEVIGKIAEGEPSTALILVMHMRSAVDKGALINGLRVEPELGTPMCGGLPKTIARCVDGGWRLSGRNIYATGSEGLT
ncbi:MAG TPA: acyl-CoA dehydrogenase family protein [Pseudolabrys sp.]|nr:acyl-CoA dehydrogenase family protein [Pseudolabrys sp.]